MDPPPHGPHGKDFFHKNPAAPVVVPTLSLLLGQSAFSLPYLWILSTSLLILMIAACLAWFRKKSWALLFIISGLAFWVGFSMHVRLLNPEFPEHHIARKTDGKKPLYVEGGFYREPVRLPDRSRWYLRVERIWRPLGAQETEGDVLVTVRDSQRDWHYGDLVRFRVRLRPPRPAGNPGEFNYRAYLHRRKIYLTGYLENDGEVELLLRDTHGPRLWMEHLRREIRRFIDGHLPGREGGLLKALVIGDRGGLSREERERFVAAGVAHLLSISGLHVGMLGLVAFIIARTFGSFSTTLMLRWSLLKAATIVSFLAVLFYTGLSGGRVPTVRAAIMVGVYGLAVLMDREEEFYTSLALAALMIGLVWPGVVLDISFQLSFLAVLFIVWGLRRIQEMRPLPAKEDPLRKRGWLHRWLPRLALSIAVPVLATIGTGPVVAFHFGRISIAGFLANPILVPLVGFLLVPLGFFIGFISLLSTTLALPFIWLAKPFLSLTLALVEFFADLPMSNITVPPPTVAELGLLYLAICSVLVLRQRRHVYLFLSCMLAAVLMDGAYWWRQRWGRGDLRVTYLSVGHGDAAVVEFPGSKVLLIDAGGSAFGRFDPGRSIIAPFLRSRRIAKLDYVLVSHPRVDHYGGMKSIIKEFTPSEFWSGHSRAETSRYLDLERTVTDAGIKRVVLSRDDSCREMGEVQLCVLYPPVGFARETSVVFRLSMGRFHFLFPGDIQRRDEKRLVALESALSSQVLKVPRHGSATASTEAFVDAVRPKLAIFSVGHRPPRGEVVARYKDGNSEILRTDRDGAVVVETNGEELRYWTYRNRKEGNISP